MKKTQRRPSGVYRIPWSIRVCVGVLVAAAGCGSPAAVQDDDIPCWAPGNEFPPSHCAIVEGQAVDMDGQPIPSIYLRTDSIYPSLGALYAPWMIGATDSTGAFELIVGRYNTLIDQVITSPDTVTLQIKAYLDPGPGQSEVPAAQVSVRMEFFPLFEEVKITRTVVVSDLPGG